MSEWTEGVYDDGAAILRDGEMVSITELLAILNASESAIAAEREANAKIAEGFIPPAEAARRIDFHLCIRDAELAERIAAAIRARSTS